VCGVRNEMTRTGKKGEKLEKIERKNSNHTGAHPFQDMS
jgi:hypothetical protein